MVLCSEVIFAFLSAWPSYQDLPRCHQLPLWTGQAGDEGALIPAVDQGGDAPAGLQQQQDQGEAREEQA